MGGSSAINAMLHVRGNRRDFDLHWQQAAGCDWSWDAVLPYFKKSIKSSSTNDNDAIGTNGPLSIEDYPTTESGEYIKSMLQHLFEDLGFNTLNDLYGDSFIGFGRVKGILSKGTRHSSAKAFLHPSLIENRPNLHIIKMAHVKQLIVDKSSKQVTGVEFVRLPEQKMITVKMRKEVILSAGAVNTPQILMLSGIGPEHHLKSHKIDVIQSLAGVGQNLQDHIVIPQIFSFHKSTAPSASHHGIVNNFLSYLLHKSGLFSNLGSVDYMGFFSTVNDTLYPDVQIMNYLIPKQSTDTMKFLLSLFNYKQNIVDTIVAANLEADTLFAFVVLLSPKSHGKITLTSDDPFNQPKIETNYLQEIDDVQTYVRAMKIINKLPSTETFKQHEGEVVSIGLNECDQFSKGSNEYWECYVRHIPVTVYHPVGTAKMGSKDDIESVVDAQLNVHGINGLRIADASM